MEKLDVNELLFQHPELQKALLNDKRYKAAYNAVLEVYLNATSVFM